MRRLGRFHLRTFRRCGRIHCGCLIHVVDATTNQAVNDATVVVSDPLSSPATTNSSGDATITGVAPGMWSVVAGGTTVPVAIGQVFASAGQTVAANPQPTVYTPQQLPTRTITQVNRLHRPHHTAVIMPSTARLCGVQSPPPANPPTIQTR